MLRNLSIAAMTAVSLVTAAQADAPVFPASPFSASITISNILRQTAVGPKSGTLGVTSITLANFNNVTFQIRIFSPLVAGSSCSGTVTGTASITTTSFQFLLEPFKTFSLTFPTPLIFPKVGGGAVSCIAVEADTFAAGSVNVLINGFVQ